jgi:hypothetical protein
MECPDVDDQKDKLEHLLQKGVFSRNDEHEIAIEPKLSAGPEYHCARKLDCPYVSMQCFIKRNDCLISFKYSLQFDRIRFYLTCFWVCFRRIHGWKPVKVKVDAIF